MKKSAATFTTVRCLAFALVVVLSAAGGAIAGPVVKIMQLGDSLTAQLEARMFLAEKLNAAGYNYEFVGSQGSGQFAGDHHEGHSGFTIGPDQSQPGNLFDNVSTWITAAQPNIITLLVGNNDYNHKPGVDPATAPQRMEALLDKMVLLAPDAKIVVSSVLKIAWEDNYAGALNRALPDIVARQQAAGHQVVFADLNTEVNLIKGAPPYNGADGDFGDGTHLNTSGARKLADGWYTHLSPLLAVPEPPAAKTGGLLLLGATLWRLRRRKPNLLSKP